jgi:hypothetical protein
LEVSDITPPLTVAVTGEESEVNADPRAEASEEIVLVLK